MQNVEWLSSPAVAVIFVVYDFALDGEDEKKGVSASWTAGRRPRKSESNSIKDLLGEWNNFVFVVMLKFSPLFHNRN